MDDYVNSFFFCLVRLWNSLLVENFPLTLIQIALSLARIDTFYLKVHSKQLLLFAFNPFFL